jgi:hypothetical protein
LQLAPESISQLNDETWTSALKKVAAELEGKSNLKVLDLSPFPYMGILLLKHKIAKSLALSFEYRSLIEKFNLDGDLLHIEDVSQLADDQKFDLIVINPVSSQGEPNQEILLSLPVLR